MTDTPAHKRIAIYQTNDEGRCVYVNSALCDLFEITRKEALGVGWLDKVHRDDRERVLATRQYAISPIPVLHLDYRLQVSAGILWVAAFSTALMSGTVFKGRIGTIIDITD